MTAPTPLDLQRISTLHPQLQPLAIRFLQLANAALNAPDAPPKIRATRFGITQAYRSAQDQAKLYGQGRTADQLNLVGLPAHYAKPTAPRVTNAPPGRSLHEFEINGKPASRAFDFVPLTASGQPIWDASAPEWQLAGRIGKGLGLTWGGDFKSLKDLPHFEIHSVA